MKFKGLYLLAAIGALYLASFFYDADKTVLALSKSGSIFVKIVPIFLVVIFFTALINYLFKPEKIASHLGQESGFKGWVIALVAGILSHGPMYAWYPMLENLRQHGLKKGLIATFFYARSIKIPLLPIMVDYFGLAFTLILTLYILVASIVQGLLIEWLCALSNRSNS